MSNIKPTRAQMFNGLRKRPTYEEISQEINPDKTKVIYPNRDATFLRNDPRMTQLDGVSFFESMKDQEEATIKEQRKETTMRQMAKDSGEGLAETKIKHGQKEPQRFDISKDDEPTEAHEAELTEKEKYKNERTQAKKDKMAERVKNNLAKKKSTEDEFMKQTEQNQKDDLEFASAPVTGGASSSQGPSPPKQPRTPKAKVERSRSRDQEPITPKSEMKSESEATPKVKKEPKEKKIKVKKEIEKKTRELKKTKKEEKLEEMKVEEQQTEEERGRDKTQKAKAKAKVERSRSRDRPKSEAKSEKSEPKSVKRELFKDETPKVKKERKRKQSPPDSADVKAEIERINAQTSPTKSETAALNRAVKKQLEKEKDPESTHEPKGKRGRPKSVTEAASSSQTPNSAASSSQSPKKESWDATLSDSKTSKSYWNTKSMPYIVNQLRLRGFESPKSEWNEIKKLTKVGLVKMVMELVVNDKW